MKWDYFIWFALPALGCWAAGAWYAAKAAVGEGEGRGSDTVATAAGVFPTERGASGGGVGSPAQAPGFYRVVGWNLAGLLIFLSFIIGLWISLERPPMRTLGETRLWYSFFLPVAGIVTFARWRYRWILSFSTLLSAVFIGINLLKPEIHSKTLMPALQSPWFAPHVIVYMMAYAVLGAAAIAAMYGLVRKKQPDPVFVSLCDNLVYVGTAFLTIGMLFGALWAKEAWGHYWSWDPKETWAASTWLGNLLYIHFRLYHAGKLRPALWLLLGAFLLLQVCWFGVNYLPSAKGTSVHTYTLD